MRFEPCPNVIDLNGVRGARLFPLDIAIECYSEIDALSRQMELRFRATFEEVRLAHKTLEALKTSALQAIACPVKARLSNTLNTFSLAAGPFLLHFEIRAGERAGEKAALVGLLLRDPPPDGGGCGASATALNSSHLEHRIAFAARRYGSNGFAIAAALVATGRGELTAFGFDALCRALRILTGVDPSVIIMRVLHEALHAPAVAAPPLGDDVSPHRQTLCHTRLTSTSLSGLLSDQLRLALQGDAALRFRAILSAARANDDDT